MKIKPYGRNLLIKPVVKQQVLVADKGTLCEYGEVLGVGEDVKHIKVGDQVGFLIWGINQLMVEGEMFYFVPETDEFLLGTIEK